jgi:hypothetical protein
VHAQVVEVATGRLRLADDVYCQQADRDTKRFTVDGLVDKIQRRFPLVAGTVVSAAGEEATLSVGANQGVETGARFVVIRKAGDPPDIKSGEVRKQGDRFIELDVVRVKADTAVARVLPSVAGDNVKGGDYVYAR